MDKITLKDCGEYGFGLYHNKQFGENCIIVPKTQWDFLIKEVKSMPCEECNGEGGERHPECPMGEQFNPCPSCNGSNRKHRID